MSKTIWTPTAGYRSSSALADYMNYLADNFDRSFSDYQDLWKWSIQNLEEFWETQVGYHQISYSGHYDRVLRRDTHTFIGNRWFEGIALNYSEHIFRDKKETEVAMIYKNEIGKAQEISWKELKFKTQLFVTLLKDRGIEKGDRVAGVLNNTPDTIALFFAAQSLGAIWSCCSPDFGMESIVDRFAQIDPQILFCAGHYQYNGRAYDKSDIAGDLVKRIASLEEVIILDAETMKELEENAVVEPLSFERLDFNDPIWILYSSGTTGKPKAITHSVGGILLEHYKALALHQNVQNGDRFIWYSTTGWMMWNYAVSALLCGAILVIYDGSLAYPNDQVLWNFCQEYRVDHLGLGAAFLTQHYPENTKGYQPKTLGSTGSPLPPHAFERLQAIFKNTQIISLSGGTDVCSAFLSGCALWPVHAGEIQCRTLGADITAFNEEGEEVENDIGELVIRQVMPSMPLYFWGDEGNKRYHASYFEKFPNVWRHGDWIKITKDRGIIIYGRSDATLNRHGVRIGTAEIYNKLDSFDEIKDTLVLALEDEKGDASIYLYVQMEGDNRLDEDLIKRIKKELREKCSPRHVPDFFYTVPDIPYTLSGKKMEIPVKKILQGVPLKKAVSIEVSRNPKAFDYWIKQARETKS